MQVLDAAGPLEVADLRELVGDGDDVGRLAVRIEREDRVEHDLVLGHVEVDAAHGLDDVGDRVFREHHAAESALLCQEVVRRHAFAAAGVTVVGRFGEPDVRDRQLHDLRFQPSGRVRVRP